MQGKSPEGFRHQLGLEGDEEVKEPDLLPPWLGPGMGEGWGEAAAELRKGRAATLGLAGLRGPLMGQVRERGVGTQQTKAESGENAAT